MRRKGAISMNEVEFTSLLDTIIEEAKTAIFATVDKEGRPHMRWMTPTLLPDRPGVVYAVTSPDFKKITHLEGNPRGSWMFQTRLLSKVATVSGPVNVVDNSAMKAEVLEGIGRRLNVFWRVNKDPSKLVVLETVIEKAEYSEPMKSVYEHISFKG
jgi:general stress protein 26